MLHPFPTFKFSVQWGGGNLSFQEVTGLNREVETIPYRGGNSPISSDTYLPGRAKLEPIVMKRGMFKGDMDFHLWAAAIQVDANFRRSVIISLLDQFHVPVVVWTAINCIPTKIEGPQLKANASEVAIESITVVHEGLEVVYL